MQTQPVAGRVNRTCPVGLLLFDLSWEVHIDVCLRLCDTSMVVIRRALINVYISGWLARVSIKKMSERKNVASEKNCEKKYTRTLLM